MEKKDIEKYVKSARKQSRDEEIDFHGKPLKRTSITKNKKKYNRKNNKKILDNE